jgi:2-haloacid dehalogenase
MRKPFPEFYQVLLDRYNVKPQEALFIDDNFRNIQAAEKMSINSIHFTTASELKKKLQELELLQ